MQIKQEKKKFLVYKQIPHANKEHLKCSETMTALFLSFCS